MVSLVFITRTLLATVFLTAAVGKFRFPAAFQETIQQVGFRRSLAPLIMWLVIIWEGMLGGLFILGIFPSLAAIASISLLLLFMSVSILAMRRREQIPCNCFGRSTSPLGYQTLLRALILVVPILLYYFSTLSTPSDWWPTTLDTALLLLSLTIGLILLTRWVLAARSIMKLARDLQKSSEEVAYQRALQSMQQKEGNAQ